MIFDIFSKYPHILNCKLRLEIHLKRVFCRRQRQDNERKIQTLYGVRYQLVIAALLSVTYGLNVHILNICIYFWLTASFERGQSAVNCLVINQ